jgi:hypothetical protein
MENVCMSAGALLTLAALALATAGCGSQVGSGSSPTKGSEWSTYHDPARRFEIRLPNSPRLDPSVKPDWQASP